MDRDLLAKIRVLYVEDEESLRTSLRDQLNIVLKEVIVSQDGFDGLEKFKYMKKNNIPLDVIISDIEMPKLNGIEMVKEIRKTDPDIPIIFTTAYKASDYILDALHLDVSHYLIKPLDVRQLIEHIYTIFLNSYNQKVLEHTKVELERYMDTVNQVALMSKTDPNGIIKYVNDIYCEVSGYSKDELIGQKHSIIKSPETSSEVFKEMWTEISNGKSWKGKIKNRTKNKEEFYLHNNIFPVYNENDEIKEYIGIGFLTTEVELEKKDFRKKVSERLRESQRRDFISRNKIDNLEKEITEMKRELESTEYLKEHIFKERQRAKEAKAQVKVFEDQNKALNEKHTKLIESITYNKNLWIIKQNESDEVIKGLKRKIKNLEEKLKEKSI